MREREREKGERRKEEVIERQLGMKEENSMREKGRGWGRERENEMSSREKGVREKERKEKENV